MASAASSVGMVAVSSLLQAVSRGDPANQARLNSHYRLLAAVVATIYPAFVAHGLLPLLPPSQAYGLSFAIAGLLLIAGALSVRSGFYDALLPPRPAVGVVYEGADSTTPSPATTAIAATGLANRVLHSIVAPYITVWEHPAVAQTIAALTFMALPAHVVGVLSTNLFFDFGASEEYQATCNSLAALAALAAIFYARSLVQRLTARTTYGLVTLLHGACLMVMGCSRQLWVASVAFVLVSVLNKASPVATSVWISDVSPTHVLPAAFAADKLANCATRAFWSEGLARLADAYSLGALFVASGCTMAVFAVAELATDPNVRGYLSWGRAVAVDRDGSEVNGAANRKSKRS